MQRRAPITAILGLFNAAIEPLQNSTSGGSGICRSKGGYVSSVYPITPMPERFSGATNSFCRFARRFRCFGHWRSCNCVAASCDTSKSQCDRPRRGQRSSNHSKCAVCGLISAADDGNNLNRLKSRPQTDGCHHAAASAPSRKSQEAELWVRGWRQKTRACDHSKGRIVANNQRS